MNTLFNKVLGENEKCAFYFYLKTEGTFWPTSIKRHLYMDWILDIFRGVLILLRVIMALLLSKKTSKFL